MAEDAQRPLLRGSQFMRHTVHHAQGAERVAFGGDQRRAGVKTDVRVAGDQRIIGEALVARGVGHDEQIRLVNRVAAEGNVARCFSGVEPDPRLEPLALLVHQRNQRDRRTADVRGERGEIV